MDSLKELFATPGWESIIVPIAVVFATLLAGVAMYRVLFFVLGHLAGRAGTPLGSIMAERLRGPARMLLPLLAIMLVAPSLTLSARIIEVAQHLFSLCFIAVIAWLAISATLVGRDIIISRYDVEAKDNLKARAVHTQLTVIVKIIMVIVSIIAAATMLMTFEKIRQVGVSILASAGIIGIIVGFAAQRSIATLFAGLQLALTQPIRINDVVIVEGEWGWVEEITLTYVVVKIWDLRRLVVPVSNFLEKPFQNWTRISADLMGTVFLFTDYAVPVEEIRQQLHEILQGSDKWDRRVWGMQVTNATERTMELRALVSAADSSTLWDLRCEVREKLLTFLQNNYPESFPRMRGNIRMEEAPGREIPATNVAGA
ncbi:MAG TPA: mechanosensitive ion channel domain-containing protein [Geobacteraceae bacterium]